jgi:Domain of unknown function (DUF4375)
MSDQPPKKRIDRIYDRIQSHGFDTLTPSERAFFAMTWFFREANNGGLETFFYNDAGGYTSDALRGFEQVGAQETAGLLRRATSVFPGGVVPTEEIRRRDFLCDLITPAQKKLLDDLTTAFYDSPEPVADLIDDYVERHPEEFPSFRDGNG